MEPKINKDFKVFTTLISKLEPEEFIGLCKILKVNPVLPLADGQNVAEARPIEEIFEDLFTAFTYLNRTQRRNLLKILKAATK